MLIADARLSCMPNNNRYGKECLSRLRSPPQRRYTSPVGVCGAEPICSRLTDTQQIFLIGDHMKILVKCLSGLLVTALAGSAMAQATIAELGGVVGNVLVSTATGMASGVDKQRLASGTVLTTTASGAAIVAFDNGCKVELKANQRLEVKAGLSCDALALLVTAAPAAGAIGAGTAMTVGGLSGTTLALVGVGVAAGGYAIYRNNRNSSPN